jgi:hypothetical protein
MSENRIFCAKGKNGIDLYYFPSEESSRTEIFQNREKMASQTVRNDDEFRKIRSFMKDVEWNPISKADVDTTKHIKIPNMNFKPIPKHLRPEPNSQSKEHDRT